MSAGSPVGMTIESVRGRLTAPSAGTPLKGKGCEKGAKLASPTDPRRLLGGRNSLRCNAFREWVAGGSNPEPTD